MKIIFTVIIKELTDTLRDRRTLMTAIVMPIIIFPLLIWGFTYIQKSMIEKGMNKVLKIGIIDAPQDALILRACANSLATTGYYLGEDRVKESLHVPNYIY